MTWIPIAAWAAAVVVALVVLGFCGYEIVWKAKRLQSDVKKLESLAEQLQVLRGQIAETQDRLAATGLR